MDLKKFHQILFKLNDYIFVTNINDSFYAVQPHEINGSVIIMDPFNGDIVSMVGGVNYDISNFNRATQAYRQPGSSIKPFIYAQALETKNFYQIH